MDKLSLLVKGCIPVSLLSSKSSEKVFCVPRGLLCLLCTLCFVYIFSRDWEEVPEWGVVFFLEIYPLLFHVCKHWITVLLNMFHMAIGKLAKML